MKRLTIVFVMLLQLQGTFGFTIMNTLNNSSPHLGESITLSCTIAGWATRIVSWWKDKYQNTAALHVSSNCAVVDPKEYGPRLKIVQCENNNYTLQLSDVQISDRGQWVCEADGQEATNPLRLDILVPPLKPNVTNPSPVKVRDTAKLTCDAENDDVTKPVTYTWTKDGLNLPFSQGTTEHGALFISPVAMGHAGKYVCVAKNVVGSRASTEQDFVVYGPPYTLRLKTTTSSNSKWEGETETFTCEVIGGNPVPSVKLIRREGQRKETLIEESNRVVIFRRRMMRRDNQAKFYCEATGPEITSYMQSAMVTYYVFCPPSAPSKLKLVNSTAVAATLKWISEFDGGDEQKFYVQYKKTAENWVVALEVPQGGITDPGLKKPVYHRVTGLESNVWYVFRVRSKNSHPGTHTSNFSNTASGKTAEKPHTSIIGLSRTNNTVTVRWKQVTGHYTALKIRYCLTGTEDCWDYIVPNPEDTTATFSVDANRTYYYYLMVEEGGDVVYKSAEFKNTVDGKTNRAFAVVYGLVGTGVLAIAVVILAVVLSWKREQVRLAKRLGHPPANDNLDNDDTRIGENQQPGNDAVEYNDKARITVKRAGKVPVETSDNIGVVQNDAFHSALETRPGYPDNDIDAYDYVDNTWPEDSSGQNQAPEHQENQTECATLHEPCRQSVPSEKSGGQEREELQGTESHESILIQEQPDQCKANRVSSQGIGAHGQTPSLQDDDKAHDKEPAYASLGPVAPVKHGEYLNLRRFSSEK